VVVDTGTVVSIYINGALSTSMNWPKAKPSLQSQYRIGSIANSGVGLPFDGLIDDVRIYNRALSAAEVAQLYNTP